MRFPTNVFIFLREGLISNQKVNMIINLGEPLSDEKILQGLISIGVVAVSLLILGAFRTTRSVFFQGVETEEKIKEWIKRDMSK